MKRLKFLKGKADEKKKEGKAPARPRDADEDRQPDVLEETFNKFDTDGNGYLTLDEMFEAMKEIMSDKVTMPLVKKVMDEIDANGSGTIELEEFYDFFEKCDELCESGWLDQHAAVATSLDDHQTASGVPGVAAGGAGSACVQPNQGTKDEMLALLKEMKANNETQMAALR